MLVIPRICTGLQLAVISLAKPYGGEQTGLTLQQTFSCRQKDLRPVRFENRGIVVPQKSWSAKRERQYVHIKDSLLDPGTSDEIEAAYDTHMADPSRAVAASAVKARLAYPFRPCRRSHCAPQRSRRASCRRAADRLVGNSNQTTAERGRRFEAAKPPCVDVGHPDAGGLAKRLNSQYARGGTLQK